MADGVVEAVHSDCADLQRSGSRLTRKRFMTTFQGFNNDVVTQKTVCRHQGNHPMCTTQEYRGLKVHRNVTSEVIKGQIKGPRSVETAYARHQQVICRQEAASRERLRQEVSKGN